VHNQELMLKEIYSASNEANNPAVENRYGPFFRPSFSFVPSSLSRTVPSHCSFLLLYKVSSFLPFRSALSVPSFPSFRSFRSFLRCFTSVPSFRAFPSSVPSFASFLPSLPALPSFLEGTSCWWKRSLTLVLRRRPAASPTTVPSPP
jgi:hypothetical protein